LRIPFNASSHARRLVGRLSRRPKVPLFVVGCQRSGTTMVLRVLSRARDCRVYHEDNREAFDAEFRLRDDATILRLIEESPEPVVVFKPLVDSHRTSRLLELHPNARAVWLYRHYRDVAGSAVRKWGDDFRDATWGFASGEAETLDQRILSEHVTGGTAALLRTLCEGAEPTPANGAALYWYLRNVLYFDLQDDPRVLLIKYRDVVTNPERSFGRIRAFAGGGSSGEGLDTVRADSLGKHAGLRLDRAIEERCEGLLGSLDELRRSDGRASLAT
jgi:hypothetical protein